MDKTKRMGGIVTVVIYILIALAVGLMIAMPFIMRPAVGEFLGGRTIALIALYAGGSAGLWFLIELLLIMRSVKAGDPFVERNVASLKRIAIACIVASAAVILVLCFRFSIAFALCAIILAFGALAAFTLALVFRRAVEYKEENDLTV